MKPVSLKTNTLAYQTGARFGLQHRDMGHMPLWRVVESMGAFRKSKSVYTQLGLDSVGFSGLQSEGPMIAPEHDALMFYLLNHATSLSRQKYHPYESLPDSVVLLWDTYHRELALRGARMFFYLLLICTREARHDGSHSGGSFYAGLNSKFGPMIKKFHTELACGGHGSDGAESYFVNNPPQVSLGVYTKYLRHTFYNGSFGSAFGGKAWGAIADVLDGFVSGKITAEMMLDTAFTLAHNTGPIFNKGMLFHQSGSALKKILDVQRSGQIPQLISSKVVPLFTDTLAHVYQECLAIYPDELGGDVDWVAVEALGSIGKYHAEKLAQFKKGKASTGVKSAKVAVPVSASSAKPVHLQTAIGKVEIYPDVFLTKVSRG